MNDRPLAPPPDLSLWHVPAAPGSVTRRGHANVEVVVAGTLRSRPAQHGPSAVDFLGTRGVVILLAIFIAIGAMGSQGQAFGYVADVIAFAFESPGPALAILIGTGVAIMLAKAGLGRLLERFDRWPEK